MSKSKPGRVKARVIKSAQAKPVKKSETSTQIEEHEVRNANDWIQHPYDLGNLATMKEESSILPQCIRAYKNNIAGFGIGVRYVTDDKETPEMKAEYDRAINILEMLTVEQDTKELFEDVIEARETYGIAYVEVMRNVAGEIEQIEFIFDTPSVSKTVKLEPYIEYSYFYRGVEYKKKKKFRKYKQQIGGKTVYYKEFGDPRVMDRSSGRYISEGETLPIDQQANEILEFTIGTKPYGEVRWIGQLLGIDGSRRAEGLNNNYFVNGRHTPLMIMIQGGTLTDDSFNKLKEYVGDIKGERGQHAFIVLETENTDPTAGFEQAEKPKIEVKDLANILQKDELFQEYLDNNRKRVQSAFLLPDLYVGYTTDFNRATAQTAKEVTEEQVFQPERISLAWAINNKLLNEYQFKYVETYFLAPNITNADDLFKILNVANNAGGLTPNKAKDVVYNMLGETSEDFEGEWGNIPLAIYKLNSSASNMDMSALTGLFGNQVAKAQRDNVSSEVVAVMKSVHKLLKEIQQKEAQ